MMLAARETVSLGTSNGEGNVIVTILPAESESRKAAKKREYNRNAQRAFRQRRKEHLRSLEAAQAESNSVQVEDTKRLRREIQLLSEENEYLKAAYKTQVSSLVPTVSSSPSKDIHYGVQYSGYGGLIPANTLYIPEFGPAALHSLTSASISSTSSVPANLVVVFPHDILEIRRKLHTMFSPLLEIPATLTSQIHLATLAALKSTLPNPLKPTPLQLSVPHDASIDMIPSPSLRDRLIAIGPAIAHSFLTEACTIACDIEDTGQMIVWGKDWLNECSWEFCPSLLERWGGFVLSPEWSQRANFWRKQRGVPVIPGDN